MFDIPSICNNPACMLMFPTRFVAETGAKISIFANCTFGHCPRCGSPGSIPNGEYRTFQINIFEILFKIGDIDKLLDIKDIIEKALHKKTERKRLNNKLKAISPEDYEQFSVVDWAKENEIVIKLVLEFLLVLIAALSLIAYCAPANVTYSTVTNKTFNQFYGFPSNESLSENRIENKKTQTKLVEI